MFGIFFTLKLCKQDIAKTIWARSLIFNTLIEDTLYITWLTFEQILRNFAELWSFVIFDIESLLASYIENYFR